MKSFIIASTAILAAATALFCGNSANAQGKDSSRKLTEKSESFTFEFISRINDKAPEDYIVSPLGMQFLLGMVLDGARGNTAKEICRVLGYGSDEVREMNAYNRSMLQRLPELDGKTRLSIANAIVVNQSYPLLESYQDTVRKYYGAEVSNQDFSDAKGTAARINEWCSRNTDGMIPSILDKVDKKMLAYLLNAICFKGKWQDRFNRKNTSKEPFTQADGTVVPVQMMKRNGRIMYQENDCFRSVRLPYGNGAFEMTVILPSGGKTLTEVCRALEEPSMRASLDDARKCEVDLWLPRFETGFKIKLNEVLSAMGMPLSFTRKADFKAMSKKAMCLSFVQQDAIIKVDEDGTEAAAVSSAGMFLTTAVNLRRASFHADRPFLYLITETGTGAVLFAGRYGGKSDGADDSVIKAMKNGGRINPASLSWTREPAAFSVKGDSLTITSAPHTDLWQRTYYHFRNDNAPVYQMRTSEKYFSFTVKTDFTESHHRFDQCGIVMYLDSDNWLKGSVEYENEEFQHLGSVVTDKGYSDWATTAIPADVKTMWYRFSRREDDYCIECSADGVNFSQMRICHMDAGAGEISFGVYACSPEDSSFKAVFTDMKISECAWKAHDGQQPDE